MTPETLLFEREDRVAILTPNRPERRTPSTRRWPRSWHGHGRRSRPTRRSPCVIVTGVGEEAFCTGADVTSVVQGGGFDRNDTPDEATGAELLFHA